MRSFYTKAVRNLPLEPRERSQELPHSVFPKDGRYETHCVDSVERKIFAVIANGENLARAGMRALPEHSTFSFALGLIALILLVSLVSLQ